MKGRRLVKLDFGAEVRPLEIFRPLSVEYDDVHCPFCGRQQLVHHRRFFQGVRCKNDGCRAMLNYCTKDATRDLLPREETVMVDGMRTRVGLDLNPGVFGDEKADAALLAEIAENGGL